MVDTILANIDGIMAVGAVIVYTTTFILAIMWLGKDLK